MEISHLAALPAQLQEQVSTALVYQWPADFRDFDGPSGVLRTLRERFGSWRKEHRVFLVAHFGDDLAGTFSIEYDFDAPFTPCLANLYVSPQYRSKGIGGLLLRFSERYIKKQGLSALYLWCEPDLVPYYEKRGYRVVDTPKHTEKKIHFMGKSL